MTSIHEMRDVCQEKVTDAQGRQRWRGAWWNVRFSRHVSIYLTALFVRLNVTANEVTGAMLVVGFLSFLGALPHVFYLNLASLGFFLLFNILDCCDGEVARWTRRCSQAGVYLDYTAHVLCNCPLLAAPAFHCAWRQQNLSYGILAFATVLPALWASYFRLIVPALAGRPARPRYSGDELVPNRTLADAIRRVRPFFIDPVVPPLAAIVSIILSHRWEKACVVGAVYGLLSALALGTMYFVVGFVKAKQLDLEARGVPTS
jgi:phosphatidylglycerophosphate synthase